MQYYLYDIFKIYISGISKHVAWNKSLSFIGFFKFVRYMII